ncbi:MAG: ATP-grasp domain-containing protein [Anaerolineae bacterium]
MIPNNHPGRRVLLLTTSHTYRAPAFLKAADRLGIEVVQAVDMPRQLAEQWQAPLGFPFDQPETAVQAIVDFAAAHPLDAILAVDDSGAILAARASEVLGLPRNSAAAAEAARDKYRMRQLLAAAGVPVPVYRRFFTGDDVDAMGAQVTFPVVVKPTSLSGSRGVIRADNQDELAAAVQRLTRLLDKTGPGPHPFLVESFIPGVEVALEGMLDDGRLTVLALFDKPDPLDGPFFEETIYVTPSRLATAMQTAIARCTADAARALGLRTGPIHAELRVNDGGPWIVEVAGRSIGGLCSQTLRFGPNISLEELILRQACGLGLGQWKRDTQAHGVMMIPIPEAGLLKQVGGVAEAEAVPLIESVTITAPLNNPLVPLPEGESYLGFIFSKGGTPEAVEAALRQAHDRLHFEIAPMIPLSLV